MLCAFEIDDFNSLKEGRFVECDNNRRYLQALTMISDGKLLSDGNNDLPQCFFTLMWYRREAESVLSFGSGTYHVGQALLRHTYQTIWQSIRGIKDQLAVIDAIIVAIISPEEKTFPIEELVRDFGFPDVDVTAIDLDFL